MKRIFIFFMISCMVVFANSKLIAQEIETLWDIQVTTASKQEEKLSDAPGIISVVTSEEIAGFGAVALWDVLNRVTSMYMIHAGTYLWNVGSIRGQNVSVFDNHVLILLNGRPLRDGISGGHNNVFYNSFPLEGIERIEVIRGPGSVLYGTNAFSGVINIITKEAVEETSIGGSVSYGSFNTLSANVGGGFKITDDLNVNLGLRYFDDDGPEFGFYDDDKGGKIPSVSDTMNFPRDNKSAFIDINYKGLKIMGGYGDMYPFALIPPIKWEFGGNPAGSEIKRMKHYFGDIGYEYKFNDNYSVQANVTRNSHLWEGLVGDDENGSKAVSDNTMAELTFYASPIEKLNFIAGGVYDYNNFSGAILDNGNLTNYNAYLQADYKVIDMLKLIAGFQINMPQGFDANFTPRFGAIANFNENFGLKVLYSNAFRSPYPQETNVLHRLYVGNSDLRPELINTIEAQAFFQNEKAQASLTFYKSHMTDLINKIPGPDTIAFYEDDPTKPIFATFYNDGEFDFWGIEFEGKFRLAEGLQLFSSAIYQQNVDGDGNTNTAYWPGFIGKAGLLYNKNFFSAGVWNSYFGKPTEMPNPTIDILNPEATAYNLLTANVSFDIMKLIGKDSGPKLLFSIYGDNILNEDIWFPEFARGYINTMPLHAGSSFYGKLTIGL